ncbi:tyrosine/serine/threonine protein phosphatase pps1 [Podila minutissima]|nr:tyrosine/serine/threonine protein phosphatase pps1 [Podila minutissima]
MFPWLHGVDGTSSTQNYFFGLNNSPSNPAPLPLPEHRGLIFVHANEQEPGRLLGSVSPTEILQPAPRSSPSSPVSSPNTKPIPTFGGASSSHDNNHHPQVHHQYAAITAQQQQQQQQKDKDGALTSSDWDISDSTSSVSSSSLTSTSSLAGLVTPSSAIHGSAANLGSSFVQSLSDGINIRNFKIQVPRYALLSDIVVYASEGTTDAGLILLLHVAKQISSAQEEVWRNLVQHYPHHDIDSRRQTFVLGDSFATLEDRYPELVAVSGSGRASKYKVDFWEQEREQMSLLTRASEIAPGVWLGNNADVPLLGSNASSTLASSLASPLTPSTPHASYFFSSPSTPIPTKSAIPCTPPPETTDASYPPLTPPSYTDLSSFHPSICVECRARANIPTQITLDRIQGNVLSSAAPLSTKEIFHLECLGTLTSGLNPDVFPPSTSSLSNFAASRQGARIDVSANHVMRRTVANGLVRGRQISNSVLQTQITNLINMAFFIHNVTKPTTPNQKQHQVLIHCIDGYTETALLGLVLIMIHYRLPLAEAFVKLQMDLGRSFFVYSNDAILMLEVENQVWQRILDSQEKDVSSGCGVGPVPLSPTSPSAGSPPNSSSLSSSVSSSTSSFFSALLNMSSGPQQQHPQITPPWQSSSMEGVDPVRVRDPSKCDEDMPMSLAMPFSTPEHEKQFEWFYHPEFEGSFPSRILPFLYLGNLAHASNPGLLKSLGIRYVLSVGEEAHGLHEANAMMIDSDTSSSKFMVKLVDDMFDNGVDSLWKHLENCVDFVDEARRSNTRVLIHCRVGVSRSATIVIAYLMAHYNMSLADAYLMVRARRLSVIIQPNLLFMYELLQWEQRLRGRINPLGWPGIAREVHSLNMYYIGA